MSKDKANDSINRRLTPDKKTGSIGKKIAILLLTCVVVGLCGVIVFLVVGKDKQKYNTIITPDNIDSVIAQLNEAEYTPIGSYEVNMNSKWTFPDGNSASTDAYVGNSVNNRNSVYFTVNLTSDKSEIFKSPILTVGSHIENLKLDKELAAGVYDAVVTYHLLDDNQKELSSVSVSVQITINK